MDGNKKRILLIEDNKDARELYEELLLKDYDVETANDGEDGLGKIRASNNYDLLILDIMMPKLDGVSLLRIKNKDSQIAKIPVVVLSNLGQEEVLKTCFNQGVKYYILKAETNPDQFLSVIKQALAG